MTQLAPPPGQRGAVPTSRRASSGAGYASVPAASRRSRVPARGRHATTAGQGFGYVVKWTVLGALLPGSALIAAGRRRTGWFVSSVVIAVGLLALAWLAMNGSVTDLASAGGKIAVDPQRLLIVAVASIVSAVVLALVLLAGHAALRERSMLTQGQRLAASALVTTLLAAIAVPAAKGAQYALITRDLVDSVFAEGHVKPGKAPVVAAKDPWANFTRVNVLIMGSDAGKGRDGLRPDSMILASITPKTGDTVMFNIPRNLQRVQFPDGSVGAELWPHGFGPVGSGAGRTPCGADGSWCEINAVWRTAEDSTTAADAYRQRYGQEVNVGLAATEEAVTGLLGLEPNYYVMLNLAGFKDFVDAIGGITVNVRAENERGLPIGGDANHRVAEGGWIRNGDGQHLDGYHALWFARSRWGELSGDYSRMKRQRCAIAAIADQSDPVTLAQAFPKIAASLKTNLSTDIPRDELKAWVDLALRVKKGKVRSLPILKETYGGNWAEPDFAMLRQVVEKNLEAPAAVSPSPSPTVSAAGTPSKPASGGKHRTSKPVKVVDEASTAQDVKSVC
ncbi:MAG: LCP family protein [Kineosporiaceae bacterium]